MSKRLFKIMVAVLAIAAAATGPARAQSNSEQLFYTLDGTQTGGSAYYYPSNVITQGGITWSVTGNTAINPWRIGGKSLNAVDRDVYCEGSLDETITKVSLDFGAVSGITVNSVTMIVASDAAFNNVIESKSVNFSTNSNVDVTPGTGIEWTDAYYKFVFNVSVSGSSNKYFQLKSIKFYYTSGGSTPEPEPAPAVPHTVRFAAGNNGWQVQDVTASASATAPAVLQNVMAGDSLVVTAPATLPGKVKSVKAVKYVPPAATVTTAPTATATLIEANSTTALVNAGAANGGTMMYAVTTTNAQPASTADFSATRPTAEGRTAGTYYVWYYAKADANHSDSEIAGPVSVTLAVMATVTWNSTNVFNSAHENEAIDQFSQNPRTYEGITISGSELDYSFFKAYDHMAQAGMLICYGDEGDSFTFTAPQGKMFCKIEIINNSGVSFVDYGDWTSDETGEKFVWSGTAANTVTLGTVYNFADDLNSIVFKLIDD